MVVGRSGCKEGAVPGRRGESYREGGWRDCGLTRDARTSIGVLPLVGWRREKKGDSTIRILIDDGGRKGRLIEEIWACGLMKG